MERDDRALALEIALHGLEKAESTSSPEAVDRARAYLAGLATSSGREALGAALLVLQTTIERANRNGEDKVVLDGVKKLAELARLADFSANDSANRTEQSERETVALAYLESTGVIPKGLELPEAARLLAQYVIDEILTRKKENTE